MPNLLRERMEAGETVTNGWITIPDGFCAEVMAQAGWDSITVDLQHGLADHHSLVVCLQAIARFNLPTLARVPWNEPGIIGRVLDAGAMGVICPMINSRAECEQLVRATRYAPAGARSYGPIRATAYGTAGTYYQTAARDVLCLAMIETPEAIANLDDILDVPGLDGVFVGPGDLGLCMGFAPFVDRREPEILAAYRTIADKTRAKGLFAGIHNATADYTMEMAQMGFQFNAILSDSGFLQKAAAAEVTRFKALLAGDAA